MYHSHLAIPRTEEPSICRDLCQLQTLHVDPVPRYEEVFLGGGTLHIVVEVPCPDPKITVDENQ